MPVRMLAPKGVDLAGSHIDWRKERESARTLDPEGRWIVMSHIGGEENKPSYIGVWNPSPSKSVLKP